MANAQTFAGHLARAVELFRDPAAKKAQKQEFRALVEIVKESAVTVAVREAKLFVNEAAVEGPEVELLLARLALHGVQEIILPRDTPVSHVFELVQALAEDPEREDMRTRLRESGAHRLSIVALGGAAMPLPQGADVLGTGGLLRGDPMAEFHSVPVPGAGGVTHEPSTDADSALPGAGHAEVGASAYDPLAPEPVAEPTPAPPAEPTPPPGAAAAAPPPAAPPPPSPPHPPPPPPPSSERALPAASAPSPIPLPPPPFYPPSAPSAQAPAPRASADRESAPPAAAPPPAPPARAPAAGTPPAGVGPLPGIMPERVPVEEPDETLPTDAPRISQETASAIFAPAVARSKEASEVLRQLIASPQGPETTSLLSVLSRQVETESRNGNWEIVLGIMAGITVIEQTVDDEAVRRPYGITLRRMMSRGVLREIVSLALAPLHQNAAIIVLRRAGADGVELLLDLLIAARTSNERHVVFNALSQMKEGTDQLVRLLNDARWFVVRNAAELAGEMQLEAAIPALGGALDHDDERVRKAAALALSKIGTSPTVEHLRRALRDRVPAVRQQAALGVGRRATALAMSLVVALNEESDPEVERELTLALGRIGSPDAVQALIKLVQPAGRIFGRKPIAKRLAALEALRIAASPVAIGTLQGLANDADKQVRAAAQSALHGIRAREERASASTPAAG